VLDAVGGDAQEEVGQEAVAVGAHGDQVAAAFADPADDFGGGVAVGQLGLGGDAQGLEFDADGFQVGVAATCRAPGSE
jgi:hypothetical protein